MSMHVENRNKLIRQTYLQESDGVKTCTAENPLFLPCKMTASDAMLNNINSERKILFAVCTMNWKNDVSISNQLTIIVHNNG